MGQTQIATRRGAVLALILKICCSEVEETGWGESVRWCWSTVMETSFGNQPLAPNIRFNYYFTLFGGDLKR
jgi:hypothetical protein